MSDIPNGSPTVVHKHSANSITVVVTDREIILLIKHSHYL